MNRGFRIAGALCCLLAVLVLNGGHWALLQTFAWGKMFIAFSQQNSLGKAITKTFDGRHPCALCMTVRTGLHEQQQQQQKETAPLTAPQELPEPLWELRQTVAPSPQLFSFEEQPFVPRWAADFIETPPSPPPRG